jgi:hypothetical protein
MPSSSAYPLEVIIQASPQKGKEYLLGDNCQAVPLSAAGTDHYPETINFTKKAYFKKFFEKIQTKLHNKYDKYL